MTPSIQLHRPARASNYLTVATAADDYKRFLGSGVVQSLFGWSLVVRERQPVQSCRGCVVCDPRGQGGWHPRTRTRLVQRLFASRVEAEAWLAYVAGQRVTG